MTNEIFGVQAPKEACTDIKCPFHGKVTVKNELFKGEIVKKDINRSATMVWHRSQLVPKYERYEVRRSRMRLHNPACINAKIGDKVLAAKTRPLSKSKNHVIIQIIGSGGTEASDEKLATHKKSKKVEEHPKANNQNSGMVVDSDRDHKTNNPPNNSPSNTNQQDNNQEDDE
jgi:small subunit ribosomal protein S17